MTLSDGEATLIWVPTSLPPVEVTHLFHNGVDEEICES